MICHHSKCIFVHIPKTAGSSIEHIFLNRLGLSRATRMPLCLGDNYMPGRDPPHLEHLKACEYVDKKFIPLEMYNEYFKFTFVRNPWDRMVSFYKFIPYNRRCDFKTFVMERFWKEVLLGRFSWFVIPQCYFIYDKQNRLLVDFVGRFENLQSDFAKVCSRLGWPEIQVPQVNKSEKILNPSLSLKRMLKLMQDKKYSQLNDEIKFRLSGKSPTYHESYQEYYDKESIEFVGHIYKKDVKLFGYSFDAPKI